MTKQELPLIVTLCLAVLLGSWLGLSLATINQRDDVIKRQQLEISTLKQENEALSEINFNLNEKNRELRVAK